MAWYRSGNTAIFKRLQLILSEGQVLIASMYILSTFLDTIFSSRTMGSRVEI